MDSSERSENEQIRANTYISGMSGRGVTEDIQESSIICKNKSADYETMNANVDMIQDQSTLMKKGLKTTMIMSITI